MSVWVIKYVQTEQYHRITTDSARVEQRRGTKAEEESALWGSTERGKGVAGASVVIMLRGHGR